MKSSFGGVQKLEKNSSAQDLVQFIKVRSWRPGLQRLTNTGENHDLQGSLLHAGITLAQTLNDATQAGG